MRLFIVFMFLGLGTSLLAQPKLNDKSIYEFRGVWIATVENIDWPSKRGLTNDEQKREFQQLLDLHQQNGMNVIIMQIRPSGDALYPSVLEPWSEYLMGKQGLPPSPFYDPLSYMIEETHKRGMEFHAWINPYRAVFNVNKSSIAPSHLSKLHPEWFLTYGDKKYFNPGLPEVWQHTNRVVRDVVSRYDIDAIHMDDYFYPYRIAGKEFPDHATYAKYKRGLNLEDWRRSNCDTIIKQLSQTIHAIKPSVQFGISPFGIWRNKSKDPRGSETKGGQTNYDDLYADILLWMQKGWIDYVTPQLYWEHGHALADYDTLVEWWNQYSYNTQVYIGHGIYRAGTTTNWRDKNEIPYQINKMRSLPNLGGSAYFSSNSFKNNPNGWNDSLQNHYYQYPALSPSIRAQYEVESPTISKLSATTLSIAVQKAKQIKAIAIICKSNQGYHIESLLPGDTRQINTKALDLNPKNKYWIACVGWQNQLSNYIAID